MQSNQREFWIKTSLFIGLVLFATKWIAFWLTKSVALESDAIEGIANIAASAFGWFAIRYSHQPADFEHPYGHGKMELMSAVFEGGLIAAAAVFIFIDGARSLVQPRLLTDLGLGLAINLGAGTVNGVLGFLLVKRGKELSSGALTSDGKHLLSDFMTTIGIFLGLLVSMWTGWAWMDGALAIVISLIMLKVSFTLVKGAFSGLMDTEDPALIRTLVGQMNQLRKSEIITLHEMRTMRAGRFVHVDVHVVVPEYLPIKEAHDLVENYGIDVLKKENIEGEFHTHIDPCERKYCGECFVQNCKIRIGSFPQGAIQAFTAESVVLKPEE